MFLFIDSDRLKNTKTSLSYLLLLDSPAKEKVSIIVNHGCPVKKT